MLSSSFLFGAEPSAQGLPVQIAIASELVRGEPVRRAQVDRCGACAVADGDHCDALAAVASRVSQWRPVRRVRRRAGWPPVLRPLTAPALPIA